MKEKILQNKKIINRNTCKFKLFFTGICVFVFLILWILWGNTALEINTYTVASENLPKSFNGYRIAHISDLHNAEFGEDNEILLQMIKETEPDMIAITGDLVDSYHTNLQVGIDFVKKVVEIAPTYYVTGNHEARIKEQEELKKGLSDAGVILLQNESIELKKDGEVIILLGVDDPSFQTDYLFGDAATVMDVCLEKLIEDFLNTEDGYLQEESYSLLLSHRPELFEVYVENDIDLVLSGHAHGGQFRLPFVGGILAPNQGFFPTYDAGSYIEETTHMIVSRGIGNSLFPFRVNNRPEVILIILQTDANSI